MSKLEDLLTPEEMAMFRAGRTVEWINGYNTGRADQRTAMEALMNRVKELEEANAALAKECYGRGLL